MKRFIAFILVTVAILPAPLALGCASETSVASEVPQATKADQVAYITLRLEGETDVNNNMGTIIRTLNAFQDINKVNITSWNIDKEQSSKTTSDNIFGLAVAYEQDRDSSASNGFEGNGVAYITLRLEGETDVNNNMGTIITTLSTFQETNNVKVISWNIDKEQSTGTTSDNIFGLTVTYK